MCHSEGMAKLINANKVFVEKVKALEEVVSERVATIQNANSSQNQDPELQSKL